MRGVGLLLLLVSCQHIQSPASEERFGLEDPYAAPGNWLKSNFHLHTTHSDGSYTGGEAASLYASMGYGALCLSDHNQYGDQDGGALRRFQEDSLVYDWNGDAELHPDWIFGSGAEAYVRDWNAPPPRWSRDRWFRQDPGRSPLPLLIPGFEASYAYFGAHFVLVGYPPGPVQPPKPGFRFLDVLDEGPGFAIVAHPGLANARAAAFAAAVPLRRFHGIEIVNGHFMTTGEVPADATPLWDALLSDGHRLWGIGSDDAHQAPTDSVSMPFNAFTMVRVRQHTAAGVLEALHAGACYASTGLLFAELGAEAGSVVASAPGAASLRVVGRGGIVRLEVAGDSLRYVVRGDEGYVRIEALGPDAHSLVPRAWSQPFFIQASGSRSGG
jgi:hypothetical protein